MENKKYQILELLHDEASEVKAFAELMSKYTQTKVAFLDIVSVEKKQNKEYNVDWFAANKSALESYYNIIENYFITEDESKISLLFLEGESGEKGNVRNKYFSVNIKANCECAIDFSFKLKAKFELKEIKSIPKIEEEAHFIKWTNEVLSKMCISYATFTKIEFSIQDRPFVAAIWIGYNEGASNFERDFVYNKIVENFLWSYSTKSIAGNLISDINLQATRAAISQVMARNTSHNIGAHVMNNLIGDLSKLNFSGFKNYKSTIKLYEGVLDDNKKLLNQISIFNNYVKCRMDYLADISFGSPLMQTNKYAYADLFKELDKVRLLLEHISGLDDFKFEIKIKKNGVDLNDSTDLLVAIPNDILGTQAFYNILENIIRNSAKHSDKSKVKGDVVFTVNLIDELDGVSEYCDVKECNRTTCSKAHQKEVENTLNEFIAVEVYDNIPVDASEKQITLDKKEKDEYKRMMGNKEPNFKTKIDYLVFSQNKKLNEDILSENSKLRSYSLGLVEMDASAAYLRKRPVEYINHKSYDIHYDESWSRPTEVNEGKGDLRGTNCRHFLKAFKKTTTINDNGTEKTEHYLGYRFFLHLPAVVLVVTELLEDASETNKRKKEELRKKGIWVIPPNEFENELRAGKVYPHEFVAIDSKITFEKVGAVNFLEYYKTSLPIRVLKVEKSKFDNDLFKAKEQILSATCNNETKIVRKSITDIWEEFLWSLRQEKHIKLEYETNGMPKRDNKVSDFYDHELNNLERIKSKFFYADALSSLGQKKLPRFNGKILKYYDVLECNPTVKFQVGESVCSKVLVIDERIQENSRKLHQDDICIEFLYKMTGIIIPEHSQINLSATTVSPYLVKKIKAFIRKYAVIENSAKNLEKEKDKLNPDLDFILIHYSILERMFSSNKNEIDEYLSCLAKNNNIVITSGRGEPNALPKGVRFINLSSVIHALVETRSKYFTNYVLHQARKSNKS